MYRVQGEHHCSGPPPLVLLPLLQRLLTRPLLKHLKLMQLLAKQLLRLPRRAHVPVTGAGTSTSTD
jgi:hypothetical protein